MAMSTRSAVLLGAIAAVVLIEALRVLLDSLEGRQPSDAQLGQLSAYS
jgi:hypothetical protein